MNPEITPEICEVCHNTYFPIEAEVCPFCLERESEADLQYYEDEDRGY